MRLVAISAALLGLLLIVGCQEPANYESSGFWPFQSAPSVYSNPVFLSVAEPQCAWELICDVIDDYFEIKLEEPIRNGVIEGRIETHPSVSPTLLEPWRNDTVGEYDRLENTLQSMRRTAVVRVHPAEKGFLVDVAVFKELEDLKQPERSTAGGATFRYDNGFERVENGSDGRQKTVNWIPKGRDALLEQRILSQLTFRASEMNANNAGLLR